LETKKRKRLFLCIHGMACTCFLIHFFFYYSCCRVGPAQDQNKWRTFFFFFFFLGDYRSQSMCAKKGGNFLHARIYSCSVSLCNKQKRLCSLIWLLLIKQTSNSKSLIYIYICHLYNQCKFAIETKTKYCYVYKYVYKTYN
jgi:hypothetical protein